MSKTFTLFLILIAAIAYTQPEITHSNIPIVGDQVIISICSDPVNPGEAGAMQIWDMSGLTETEEQSFTYIQPAQGIYADSFPDATLCAVSWMDDYSYYRTTEDSLVVEGYVVTIPPNDTSVMIYTNPEKILDLPYSHNTTFYDEFNGNLHMPGFSGLTFIGSLDFEADGYGTLILPTGTYNNVVRYRFYREQTNYFGGFPAVTTTKEQWAWVSPDYRFWLLLMEENFDGFSTTPLVWYDKNPYPVTTGLASYPESTVLVFPNPLKNGQQLTIKWDKNESAKISLSAIDGKLVNHRIVDLIDGTTAFDPGDNSAGFYILKIQTSNTNITQKISILD